MLRKWIICMEDETCECGAKDVATLVTPEIPVVGTYLKLYELGTYVIKDVYYYAISSHIDMNKVEKRDGVPYIVDDGDYNSGKIIYGVVVDLCVHENI